MREELNALPWNAFAAVWGAHATRVLALATRQRELGLTFAVDELLRYRSKFVAASRRHQHAVCVRSPKSEPAPYPTSTLHCIRAV